MSRVRTWGLVVLTLVAFVSACGGQGEPGPIDRKSITTTFRAIGEPLKIRLDLQAELEAADPDSSAFIVDVIYIPASADAPTAPFQVTLFDNEEGARERALWMESVSGGTLDVVRRKNVVLNLISVTGVRRDKLIATLASL